MKGIYLRVASLILLAAVACNARAPAPTLLSPIATPTRAPTPVPLTPTGAKPNAPVPFASGQIKTWSVAADDAFVYWTDCGDNSAATNGKVMKAPKSGGAPIALATNEACPTNLALDANKVYYLVSDPGRSYSVYV